MPRSDDMTHRLRDGPAASVAELDPLAHIRSGTGRTDPSWAGMASAALSSWGMA